VIHLVLKRSSTVIDVSGVDGEPLCTIPLLPARGTVVPLRRTAGDPLPPGHHRVVGWTRGDDERPAQLELADLDLSTEARLIDAGSARRASGSHLLDVRGIGAPTGGLGGRSGVTVRAGSSDAVPTGVGLRVARADLLRLIDLLEGDPSHGAVVLTVAGEPYFVD
jgi:hypothetical protein